MPAPKKTAVDPTKVTARLIQKCPAGTPGSVQVLGASFIALPPRQINGEGGWQKAHYERWLNIEGPFTLDLPNVSGPDGKANISRLLQRTDQNFQPGDEWIELRRDGSAHHLYTGVLINTPSISTGNIQVGGYDALWLLKKVRETEAGFWCHAPRDAMEHYTRAWVFDVATGFPEPGASVLTGSPGPTTTGSFTYEYALTNTGPPVCRLRPPPSTYGRLTMTTSPPNVGFASPDPYEPWRVEVSCYVNGPLGVGGSINLESTSGGLALTISGGTPTTAGGVSAVIFNGPDTRNLMLPGNVVFPGQVDMALEGRGRWIYIYIQGQLVGVSPMQSSIPAVNSFRYQCVTLGGLPPAPGPPVDVQSFTYERGRQWLMRGPDKGDYVLPGSPAPGGLQGEYFDDSDLRQFVGTAQNLSFQLNPTRTPYASRLDTQIYFPTAGPPPTWQPTGPARGELFSARWTGSIYLDLKNYDYRVQSVADDAMRIWVGKTRFGEQVVDAWTLAPGAVTSTYLRSIFGQVSGWYPIRVEYANILGGGAATITYERSDAPGTFTPVPSTMLSPEGIYKNQVRRDSHYDTFLAIAAAFGHQFTLAPEPLEGLFPGQLIPRVRVGRDTNVQVTDSDSANLGLSSSSEDEAIRIVADAQGIADPNGSAQLYATAVNFAQARNHMFTVTESESLADITDPNLLAQRLNSLLALRSGPWDQITSRPPGAPRLADDWPPKPVPLPSKFAFEPGDGVIRRYLTLGVNETTPSQLMSVAWDLTPLEVSAPNATYFVYPRGTYWTLRRHRQEAIAGKRNYQGQLAKYPGNPGGVTGTQSGSVATFARDIFARLALPAIPGKIGAVVLKVTRKADPTIQWTIEVNGVNTNIPVNTVGEYPVSAYAAVYDPAVQQEMYARLVPPSGTYDTAEYSLVLQLQV